jgi:hypothetical protein
MHTVEAHYLEVHSSLPTPAHTTTVVWLRAWRKHYNPDDGGRSYSKALASVNRYIQTNIKRRMAAVCRPLDYKIVKAREIRESEDLNDLQG